jgi:hypothetical protein
MPYADGRTCYDADSHLMELGDWLVQYADPDIRDRIRPLYLGAAGALAERAVREAAARRGDPTATRELEGRLWMPRAGRHSARSTPRSGAGRSTSSASRSSSSSARSPRRSSAATMKISSSAARVCTTVRWRRSALTIDD